MFLVNLVISFLVCWAFFALHQSTPFNQLFYLIRLSYLYRTIFQDLSATPKICWIIQLVLGHLDLLLCMEPAGSLTILYKSASEPQDQKAKTMQFYPPPPLLCNNRKLKLKFVLQRPSLAASSQPCLLLSPQLRVGQQILCSNLAFFYTGVCLH